MILPLQSTAVNSAATVYLPVGCRLWSFTGEADGKPTYDVFITINSYTTSGLSTYQVKLAGCKNGRRTPLFKNFPHIATTIAAPTVLGHYQIAVTSGTGVSGQLVYLSGVVGL